MFRGGKIIEIIPDQPSRGGIKTAVSTQGKMFDTHYTYNCTVYLGKWAATTRAVRNTNYLAPADMNFLPNPGSFSQSLYNFSVISTTNPTLGPTTHLLEHLYMPTGTSTFGNRFNNMIIDHNPINPAQNFAVLATSGLSGGNNFCVPATMISIRNRCFICWGGFQTSVYVSSWLDSAGTPVIVNNLIYDPTRGSMLQYDIGVQQPATAPTYTLAGSTTGTTSVTTGSNKVNNATVSGNWSLSTSSITLGGVPYPVVGSSYTTTFAVAGTATGTGGTNQLTINTFLFPVNGDWNGLTINIAAPNAESVVIASYTLGASNTTVTLTTNLAHNHTTATYTVTGEQLVLVNAYANATNLTEPYSANSGVLSWTGAGPQYCYAYYDPTSGHVSSVSPTLQITEQNQSNVNVQLTNISYSNNADSNRFSKILLFRNLSSQGGIAGGVMYAMGDPANPGNLLELTNALNSFGGATTYLDNNSDSDLLVSAGLTAPTNNNPPPGPFAHMVYWDGRVWGNPVSDPTAIYFSADITQVPFGILEECFPPATNLLRITSEDGRVLGMRVVGGTAVITTSRYSYYVSGNAPTNYRLLRFASTTYGVGDNQMAEFAGDTDVNSAALMYIGGDSKVYMLAPSYGNLSLSEPIQDLLVEFFGGGQSALSQARIQQVAANGQKYLLVAVPASGGSLNTVFLYDFDRKVWTNHDPTNGGALLNPQCYATVYQPASGQPSDFVFSNQGLVYSWLLPPTLSPNPDAAYVETFPIDFGRKSLKQLSQIRIYCNGAISQNPGNPGATANWTVQLTINENVLPEFGTMYVPTISPDPVDQLQGPSTGASSISGSPFPVDDVFARELVVNLPADETNRIIGQRFSVRVNFPTAPFVFSLGSQNSYQLYKITMIATDMEEADEASN